MSYEYVTGSALGDLDMTLHDIAQYLSKALGDDGTVHEIKVPWDNPDDGLKRSKDPDEILRRARYVKDLAIRLAGGEPLAWGLPL